MINYYLRTIFLFGLLAVQYGFLNSQVVSPFTSIYETHQRGGIVFLSNSALGCSSNPPASTGTCQLGALEAAPLGISRNDDYVSAYIDIDNDGTTFMSSSDRLNLPACSKITKAFLFWGASGNVTPGLNQVKLKVDNGPYQAVVAGFSVSNSTGFNSYHCYADVTALLSGAGVTGSITVADIPSSQAGSANTFGSWNLVVVYQNDVMNMRQLHVFNGLANLTALHPAVNINLSGFLTPTTGAVSFEVGAYTHDGDRGVTGDNLLFNGNITFLPIVDLANPAGEGMNSTVSNNGLPNLFRNPLLLNTMGSDADIYAPVNLLNTFLANFAATATVQAITTTDDYLLQALTSSIDSYEPDLKATIKAKDINAGTLNPGDIIQYRLTGYNSGSDFSTNTVLIDTLDANVNYVPNSTSIVFGPNAGAKTDVANDDQVDYDPLKRILKIRIGAGANALAGGTVTASPSGVDSTVVTYSVAVSQSCLKLSCRNTVRAMAYISGIGSVLLHTFMNAGTPGTVNSSGCSIEGATTRTVSLTSCPTPTASNSSPACTGGNVTLSATNDAEAIYTWSGPNAYTASGVSPVINAVTLSQSGTYTVTLSLPAGTCTAMATTPVTITVCTPTAVNDFTTTTVNTTVTGNAAANDLNVTSSGTFVITVQPANGTVSIHPNTGVYTFTPATGFTGVTTATYQLCNGLPVVCSQASITFTVYPNLIANPDVVNTTPSVSATGVLLTNDNGITSGANYSVSTAQLPSGTGTLLIDPATGSYTFHPNQAFTGTAQTTYTVCNVSVSPQQCSSATITLNAKPAPAPVDDHVATAINVPLSGDVSTNDGGTASGIFSIVNQPASGTLVINSSTGQFTYTPPAGFTGITTATYNLCNGAPVTCSNAVISITVYPDITANPDNIYTTPLTSTTGSLLANDLGITAGATYSVSVTQPGITVGTILLNPATGEYTFAPAALFIGTAQATYTVCNTSVNPQQCSSSTIIITVSNLPVAINDATTTVINTPVTANAGTNDSGTFLGLFTFGNVNPGTGTLTSSSLTGQYVFTPAPGFTGTTSATYTLCNLSSPPCSTAMITFTVYPNLAANDDIIVTPPSVTVNGSLLSNDSGITAGAIYSVSITQLPTSTGTLLINPATGAYTFIPSSAFTGTAQTTYTVCNTSVNPEQCSSATISIAVGNPPLAVNDGTLTVENTSVSGGVSQNDSHVSGGTFTFGNLSVGTLSTTASGQYTFLPSNGFTGTVSVAYTVCTIYSPPCSTAMLTFTVYPALTANPDLIQTVMNTSVTGNLMNNDTGISPGDTYSLVVAPVLPAVGSLSVNPSTGQYTFAPFTGFTGSTTTTYTLSQYTGSGQLQSSVTTVTIHVNTKGAAVGIAKSISHVQYNSNSTIELTYKLVVKNYSNQMLTNITVTDDLSTTFPSPATYTVISQPALNSLPGSQLALSGNYTGAGGGAQLTLPNTSTLSPGRTDTIQFRVAVDPHHVQLSYANSALVSAVHPDSTHHDRSTNGIDPDPDNNGDPADNTSATIFNYNLVKIGIAKSTGKPETDGDGCYSTTFKFTVKNYGSTPIYNIRVLDSLDHVFGPPASYSVIPFVSSANGHLMPDPLYNGSGQTNLVLTTSTLGVGQMDTLFLRLRYCSANAASYSNIAFASGTGLPNGGFVGYDVSTAGLDPDPDGDNDPEEGSVTVFFPGEALEIPQGFSPNGDGINDRFEIRGIRAYPNLELSILNRWGNLVYTKKQYDNTWEGKSREGMQFMGNDLPEGTYFYIVDLGDGQKPLKGYVYINRSVR